MRTKTIYLNFLENLLVNLSFVFVNLCFGKAESRFGNANLRMGKTYGCFTSEFSRKFARKLKLWKCKVSLWKCKPTLYGHKARDGVRRVVSANDCAAVY